MQRDKGSHPSRQSCGFFEGAYETRGEPELMIQRSDGQEFSVPVSDFDFTVSNDTEPIQVVDPVRTIEATITIRGDDDGD